MAHGTPDWGLVGPKLTIYGLDDLGEHAVRLGSPHLWDRRGDVVWLTDFRDGLGDVERFEAGGPFVVNLYTQYARQGAYCVQITGQLDDTRTTGIRKRLPFPVYSGIGAEFSFSNLDVLGYWYLRISGRIATGLFEAALRLGAAGGALWYFNDGGGWTFVRNTGAVPMGLWCESTMKLVIDMVNQEYIRAIVNEETVPLPGIAYRVAGAGGGPYLRADITVTADDDPEVTGYVDSLIVTQNEV